MTGAGAPPRLACPALRCGHDNEPGASQCRACGLPLAGYGRLTAHPAALFNRGLGAARAGDHATARDAFAALMLWQPADREARNAYALACLRGGDPATAGRCWEGLLERWPQDALARRGLAMVARAGNPPAAARAEAPAD